MTATADSLAARADGLASRREPFVHATVVRAQRPTSAHAGDTALVLPTGEIVGFVGGNCVEASVREYSLQALVSQEPLLLRVVPGGLREASLALGSSRWRTVWHVVLPTARPGLATALILGVARGIGETSPVLLTSGAAPFLVWNPTEGAMNSLPLFIYTNVRSGDPTAIQRAYGAAFVLLALVLVLFVLARLLARPRGNRPSMMSRLNPRKRS